MALKIGNTTILSGTSTAASLVLPGDLIVNGTTVTVNTTTLTVKDTNIELGVVTTPTDVTANGGGFTLKGTTNKTIIWDSTNTNWTSSENWNIASGKVFKINNTQVLSSTALGSTITSSSLTSVGTITSGTWNGSVIDTVRGGIGQNSSAWTGIIKVNAGTWSTATAGTDYLSPAGGTLTGPLVVTTSGTVTAGTNAQGQGALTNDINVITTASNNPSGVTLPTSSAGRIIRIINKGVNTVNVYPATGAQIDALGSNISISLPVNNVLEFTGTSTTQWYSSVNLSSNASTSNTGTLSGARGVTAGSATSSFVTYNGTTKTSGQFDGGATAPTNTTRLNYDGSFYATNFYGNGSNLTGIATSISSAAKSLFLSN